MKITFLRSGELDYLFHYVLTFDSSAVVRMCREERSKSSQRSNLLSRWHQLQLKLICEEMHAPQLVNWRQAGEKKGPNMSDLKQYIQSIV